MSIVPLPVRIAAPLWALCLAAAACSNGSPTTASADDANATEADDDSTGAVDDTNPSSTPDTPMDAAAISELLFPDYESMDPADEWARHQEQERTRQQLIADCMAAEGFEYIPVTQPDHVTFDPTSEEDTSTREWAEKHGFGFTSWLDEGLGPPIDEPEWVDPNQAYVDGLSESARDAYFAALYGDMSEFEDEVVDSDEGDVEGDEVIVDLGPQGCEGEAWLATSEFADAEKIYAVYSDELQDLYERVEADPRIVDANRDWATCMAEGGYSFSTPDDMWQELDRRTEPIWESMAWPGDDLTPEEIEAMSDEQLDALYSQPPTYDEDLAAEVREYEIGVAVTSFDCGGGLQRDLWEEVYADHQELFIEENLAGLQALLSQGD